MAFAVLQEECGGSNGRWECVASSSLAPASSVRQTDTTSQAQFSAYAKIYHESVSLLSAVAENMDPGITTPPQG